MPLGSDQLRYLGCVLIVAFRLAAYREVPGCCVLTSTHRAPTGRPARNERAGRLVTALRLVPMASEADAWLCALAQSSMSTVVNVVMCRGWLAMMPV